MEEHKNVLFTISYHNKKIILSTKHSLDTDPPLTIEFSPNGSHRCVLIKSNSAPPIPLEFNPNDWFSHRESFQAEVPNFKVISDEETKQGWKKLQENKTVTRKTVTLKKVHIIPPFLALSFLEAPNNLPETILSHFLDTIERETDILDVFDADKIPTSIEDIVRFLFLCIQGQAEEANFTETIMDDCVEDSWWKTTTESLSFTEEEIEGFKTSQFCEDAIPR